MPRRAGPDLSAAGLHDCPCGARHLIKPGLPGRRCAIHQENLPCVEWGGPINDRNWLCVFHRTAWATTGETADEFVTAPLQNGLFPG